MTQVLVAVPAHDEEDELGGCLTSVMTAARYAVEQGSVEGVTIGVGLNRCTDDSAEVARAALVSWPDAVVRVDETSRTVGDVRAHLIGALACRRPTDPRTTWVFSTDADSRVPLEWISSVLAQTEAIAAVAAAGLVTLREWSAPSDAHLAYRQVIAAGMHGDRHTHVYGANLAVRLDAYRRVGGFASAHGEDQNLVDRLRIAGEHVATLMTPVVHTSAREPGRATAGLGTLLKTIRDESCL